MQSLFQKGGGACWLYETNPFWQYDLQLKFNLCVEQWPMEVCPSMSPNLPFFFLMVPYCAHFQCVISHPRLRQGSLARFIIEIKHSSLKISIFSSLFQPLEKHFVFSHPAKTNVWPSTNEITRVVKERGGPKHLSGDFKENTDLSDIAWGWFPRQTTGKHMPLQNCCKQKTSKRWTFLVLMRSQSDI